MLTNTNTYLPEVNTPSDNNYSYSLRVMPKVTSATFGNACHAIVSALILSYTTATFLFAKPGSTFFDEEWVQHGFCVIQQDIPYRNSHDLCFYADIVLVAIGLLIYRSLRGVPTPEMKYSDDMMLFNMLGHLGHGVAHGFIASTFRSGDYVRAQQTTGFERWSTLDEGGDEMGVLKQLSIYILFWIGLLKGVLPKVSTRRVVILAVMVSIVGELFVKDVLSFAYVQAVMTVASASTQLMLPRKEKNFAYAAFASTGVPLSILPWIESTMCQDIAAKFGGHLIYDMAIPTLLIVAYYSTWCHYSIHNREKIA